MAKKVILFYRGDRQQNLFYKLKNANLRNPKNLVEYAHYAGETAWNELIDNFKVVHRGSIVKNSVAIDYDTNFIVLYQDAITKEEVIVVDFENILILLQE